MSEILDAIQRLQAVLSERGVQLTGLQFGSKTDLVALTHFADADGWLTALAAPNTPPSISGLSIYLKSRSEP